MQAAGGGSVRTGSDLEEKLDGGMGGGWSVKDIDAIINFGEGAIIASITSTSDFSFVPDSLEGTPISGDKGTGRQWLSVLDKLPAMIDT